MKREQVCDKGFNYLVRQLDYGNILGVIHNNMVRQRCILYSEQRNTPTDEKYSVFC